MKKKTQKKIAKKNTVANKKVSKRKGNETQKRKSAKSTDVHFGGYAVHGPSHWGEAVLKSYMGKLEKSDLVKSSDTSVFAKSNNHGRSQSTTKFTAHGGPTELLFGSAVFLAKLYTSHMVKEILKELFTGETGKVLKTFVKSKVFQSFDRPIRYEYRILIPESRVTLTILIRGSNPKMFEKSRSVIAEAEKLAYSWCGANDPQGGYITFQIKDGVLSPAPFITPEPFRG